MGTHALLLWEVSWWSRSHSACSTRSFRASQPGLDLRKKRGYWIPNLGRDGKHLSLMSFIFLSPSRSKRPRREWRGMGAGAGERASKRPPCDSVTGLSPESCPKALRSREPWVPRDRDAAAVTR